MAIIGAGTMGKQLAERAAFCNYFVHLQNRNSSRFEDFVKETNEAVSKKGASGKINLYENLSEAVKDADFIIETVSEKLELKKEIFSQIDKAAPPHAIITTNSSSFPISMIEDAVERKDKVLNTHFYSLPQVPMADIMGGTKTTSETFEKGRAWLESIDVSPLKVKKECYGFVFNRVWRAIKKEVLKVWAGGYADFEDVDQAWRLYTSAHHHDGPFRIMDEIGLDVVYDIEMSYYKKSGDPNDKPPQALKDKVDRGELGKKTGKGFYEY